MTLSNTALVTVNQAKAFIKIDAAASLHIDAEYVGAGTGSEDDFTLDHAPNEGTLKLYVDNVLQVETTNFTLTGAAVKFVTGSIPGNGKIVTASYDYAASSNTFESYDDDILVQLIEAATKKAEDFTERKFVNATITEKHIGDGLKTLCLYRRPVNSVTSVSYEVTERFTGDGSEQDFTLAGTPEGSTLNVYVDGVLKASPADYSLSGQVVTFVTAPADEAKIITRYNVALDLVTDYTESLAIGRLLGLWLKNYTYQVIYSAGYGADRDTVQPLIPDAVTAVLIAVANWYNNRLGLRSESAAGIGSVDYGDPGELPAASKKLLQSLRV